MNSQTSEIRRPRLVAERRVSTAQLVYNDLRERIISLELAPDVALSRADLADDYGVSQTPVREAILRLEQEGLVLSFPQSRTVVARIDIEQLHEAHFLRAALEMEIVRVLARLGDASAVSEAEAILDRMRQIGIDPARQAEFSECDLQYHAALFAAAGRPNLNELVRQRSGHLDRLRRLHLPTEGKMERILTQHGKILQAIRSGDEDRAAAAMRRHLSGTIANIANLIAATPEYFKTAP